MINLEKQQQISDALSILVPKGHTWVVIVPEIGNGLGKTTYLSPIHDKAALASALRTVANYLNPQN